jgi:T1SS-143 domain-containing protein
MWKGSQMSKVGPGQAETADHAQAGAALRGSLPVHGVQMAQSAQPSPSPDPSQLPQQAPPPAAPAAAPLTAPGPAITVKPSPLGNGVGASAYRLPADVSLDTVKVVGKDLVLLQKDGTPIVLENAEAAPTAEKPVPTIFTGDVEIPREAIAAAFEANGIVPAAGNGGGGAPGSSGGDFAVVPGDIGDSFGISPLLPPTDLSFTPLTPRFVNPFLRDDTGAAAPAEVIAGTGGTASLSVRQDAIDGFGSEPANPGEAQTAPVSFTAGSQPLTGFALGGISGLATDTNGDGQPDLTWVQTAPGVVEGHRGDASGEVVIRITLAGPEGGVPAGGTGSASIHVEVLDGLPDAAGAGKNLTDLGSIQVVATAPDGTTVVGTVSVATQDDVPLAGAADPATVDEDGPLRLAGGGTADSGLHGNPGGPGDIAADVNARGNLHVNYGADHVGATLAFDMAGLAAQGLTSHGAALQYAWTPGASGTFGPSGVLTAYVVEGSGENATTRSVFTLAIDGNVQGGGYEFRLLGALDHPLNDVPGGFENNLPITIGYTAVDGDGDRASGSLTVTVNDDTPVAGTPERIDHIVNGDFLDTTQSVWGAGGVYGLESSKVLGWTLASTGETGGATGDQVRLERPESGYNGVVTSDGKPYVDLEATPGNIVLSQTVSGLTAGQGYVLQFDLAAHSPSSTGLEVIWNGQVIGSFHGGETFKTISLEVFGQAGDNTVSFRETGAPDLEGSYLHGIHLYEDPTTAAGSEAVLAAAAPADLVITAAGVPLASGADGWRGGSFAKAIDFLDAPAVKVIDTGNGSIQSVTWQSTVDASDPGHATLVGKALIGGVMSTVITVAVNADGSVTYDQSAPLYHAPGTSDDGSTALTFKYTATDADGDPTSVQKATFVVTDDAPIAVQDVASVTVGGTDTTNLVLVIDRSSSMLQDPDGEGGYATRLDLAKAALQTLIDTASATKVLVVDFAADAQSSGWIDPVAAKAYIAGLATSLGTNYDAALQQLEAAYVAPHDAAGRTLAYFLSDGLPTIGDGITGGEVTAWEQFVASHGIDQVVAVGIGAGAALSALDPVAFPNGAPGNPILVTDEGQLSATLGHTVPGTLSGNVLANDHTGADGVHVASLTLDGVTYAYDAASDTITGGGKTLSGHVLTLATALGGSLAFAFADAGAAHAGDYSYASPASAGAAGHAESIGYTLVDGDGDKASSTLTIHLAASAAPEALADSIHHAGSDPIVIPFAALLANDHPGTGGDPHVTGVSGGVNGTAVIDGETVVFTPSSPGSFSTGSFTYAIADDHGGTSQASATVLDSTKNPLDGTTGAMVVGHAGLPDLLAGGSGDDSLFGLGGGDVLQSNGGQDLLVDAAGAGTLIGGPGADVFRLEVLELNVKDLIADYAPEDRIDLSALLEVPTIAAAKADDGADGSSAASDLASFIHYDKGSGALTVDADGAGGNAPLPVAQVNNDGTTALGAGSHPASITVVFEDTSHLQHTAQIHG